MTSYTKIIHPEDGRILQIYTGKDRYETYKVGDTVNWKIDPDHPGEGTLFDGVYPSESIKNRPHDLLPEEDGFTVIDDDYVIIKDHKVLKVFPFGSPLPNVEADVPHLESENRIVPYNITWWPHTLWRKKELEDAKKNFENAQRRLKWAEEDINCTNEEKHEKMMNRLGNTAADYIWDRLKSPGFVGLLTKVP